MRGNRLAGQENRNEVVRVLIGVEYNHPIKIGGPDSENEPKLIIMCWRMESLKTRKRKRKKGDGKEKKCMSTFDKRTNELYTKSLENAKNDANKVVLLLNVKSEQVMRQSRQLQYQTN